MNHGGRGIHFYQRLLGFKVHTIFLSGPHKMLLLFLNLVDYVAFFIIKIIDGKIQNSREINHEKICGREAKSNSTLKALT